MKYKIGDLAYLLGISPESIRNLEKKEIVYPKRDQDTAYRYYSSWDLTLLLANRHHRSLGFSLEDSARMMTEKDDQEVFNLIRQREESIEAEITRQIQNLQAIRAWRETAEKTERLLGKTELIQTEEHWVLPYQYMDRLAEDEQQREEIRRLASCSPYVFSCLLAHFGEDHYSVGLGIAKRGLDFLSMEPGPGFIRMPPRLCLRFSQHFNNSTFDLTELQQTAQKALTERGLTAEGPILCAFNTVTRRNEDVCALVDCFVSIK